MSDARCRMMITALTASIVLGGCSSSDTKVGPAGPKRSHGHNGLIAYERFAGARDDKRTAQIWVRLPDGGSRQLTHVAGGAFTPAWSPDGSRIAYASAHREVFAMNAEGSDVHQVSHGCADTKGCLFDSAPTWSGDGREIAFLRVYGPSTEHHPVPYEDFSFAARVELVEVGDDGRGERVLARWAGDPQPWNGAFWASDVQPWSDGPRWSPDAAQIVVPIGTTRHPTKHTSLGLALFVIDLAHRTRRRITPWAIGASSPDWSSDGTHIVFSSQGGHSPHIYVVRPDGSGLTRVFRGNNRATHTGVLTAPAWSPDARHIVFAAQPRPCPGCNQWFPMALYAINADGSGLKRLTDGPEHEANPAWGPAR